MKDIAIKMMGLATAVAVVGQGSAQAMSIVIDDFSEPAVPGFQFVSSPFMGTFSDEADGLNVIGGSRDLVLDISSAPFPPSPLSTSSFFVFDDRATWDNSDGFTSAATLQYDGDDDSGILNPIGLGGEDLTGGGILDALQVGILSSDLLLSLEFTVFTDGTNFSTLSRTLDSAVVDPVTETFNFDDFVVSAGTGADFTDVGAIQLTLSGPAAIDASLGSIEAVAVAVPEGSAGWISLGVLGLMIVSSRQVRKLV